MRKHTILMPAATLVILVPFASAQIEISSAERIVESDIDTQFATNALGAWGAAADSGVGPGEGPLDGGFTATQESHLFDLPNPEGDPFDQGFFGNSFASSYILAGGAGFEFNYTNYIYSYLEATFSIPALTEIRIDYLLIAEQVPGGESLAQFVLSDTNLSVIESRVVNGTPEMGDSQSGFVDLVLQPGEYVFSSLAAIDLAFDETLVADGFSDARANFEITIVPAPATLSLLALLPVFGRRRR